MIKRCVLFLVGDVKVSDLKTLVKTSLDEKLEDYYKKIELGNQIYDLIKVDIITNVVFLVFVGKQPIDSYANFEKIVYSKVEENITDPNISYEDFSDLKDQVFGLIRNDLERDFNIVKHGGMIVKKPKFRTVIWRKTKHFLKSTPCIVSYQIIGVSFIILTISLLVYFALLFGISYVSNRH